MSICYFASQDTSITLENLRCYALSYLYAIKTSKKYTLIVKNNLNDIIKDLIWFDIESDCGPYYQSHNDYYHSECLVRLIELGLAYYDYSHENEFLAEQDLCNSEDLFSYSRKWKLSDSVEEQKEQTKKWQEEKRKCTIRLKSPRVGNYQFDHVILDQNRNYSEWYKEAIDCIECDISCIFKSSFDKDYSFYQNFIISALGYNPPNNIIVDPLIDFNLETEEKEFLDIAIKKCHDLKFYPVNDMLRTRFYKQIGFLPLSILNYVLFNELRYFSINEMVCNYDDDWLLLDDKSVSLTKMCNVQESYNEHHSSYQKTKAYSNFISKSLDVSWNLLGDDVDQKYVDQVASVEKDILLGSDLICLKQN